jgi:hypothetical protein
MSTNRLGTKPRKTKANANRNCATALFLFLSFIFNSVQMILPSSAHAAALRDGPQVFEGTVGSSEVVMIIEAPNMDKGGVYFYRSSGRDIPIQGKAHHLEERDPNPLTNPDNNVTAVFNGVVDFNRETYDGTWSKVGAAKKVPFHLVRTSSAKVGSTSIAKVRTLRKVSKRAQTLGIAYAFPAVEGLKPSWIGTRVTGNAESQVFPDQTISEAFAEVSKSGYGTTNVVYNVACNSGFLLDLEVSIETVQAYPSSFDFHLVYDLRTGARIKVADVFNKNAFAVLQPVLLKQLKINIAAVDSQGEDMNSLVGDLAVIEKDLENFTITKTGLVFHHEFGFPHALLTLQPNGDVELPWKVLKPLLLSNGLLAPLAT